MHWGICLSCGTKITKRIGYPIKKTYQIEQFVCPYCKGYRAFALTKDVSLLKDSLLKKTPKTYNDERLLELLEGNHHR